MSIFSSKGSHESLQKRTEEIHEHFNELFGTYPFSTQAELDAYNQRKQREEEEYNAGFKAGGPVDETKSEEYQSGQETRMEVDADKPWWKRW